RLRGLLADEFAAEMMQSSEEVRWNDELVSLSRARQDEGPYERVGSAEFVDWLLGVGDRLAEPPQIRFEVMQLLPQSAEVFKGTWQALCVVRLWNGSESHARQEITFQCQLAVDQPSKERLGEPGWLLGCQVRQLAAVRSARPLFREVT